MLLVVRNTFVNTYNAELSVHRLADGRAAAYEDVSSISKYI